MKTLKWFRSLENFDDDAINAIGKVFSDRDVLLKACEKALYCLTEGDKTTYTHPESPYYFLHSAIKQAKSKEKNLDKKLGESEKFKDFLDNRSKEPAMTTLESLEEATALYNPSRYFVVLWFESEGDKLIGREVLPKVTGEQVRKWFNLPKNENLNDSYIIRASQKVHLDKMMYHEIDLNEFDYFLEHGSLKGQF